MSHLERMLSDIAGWAPAVVSQAARMDADRRVPSNLVDEMRSIGLFRMFVPTSQGGLEFDMPASLEVFAALGKLDGSVGWIGMICSASALFLSLLPREAYDEVYRNGPNVMIAGSTQPTGTAEAVAGGWVVSGRWPFASGCQHADWIYGFSVLTESGKPLPGPVVGAPLVRGFLRPARDWQIDETWYAAGLKATGSHHIAVRNMLVPTANCFDPTGGVPCVAGPLYQGIRQFLPLCIAATSAGIAEGALHEVVKATYSCELQANLPLRESDAFQSEVGRIQAELRAAKALLRNQAKSHWHHARAGTLRNEAKFVEGSQAAIWITSASVRIAKACFTLGGENVIYESSPLQRRLRDLLAVAQHATVHQHHMGSAGKLLLNRRSLAADALV
jgi:alkylation response protein AidB-like acyl-CoA dehydrogenase